jgi:hypothetical protein
MNQATEQLDKVFPAPPSGYVPGPTAPAKSYLDELSPFQRMADRFAYADTGQLPLGLRIRLAEQEADIQRQNQKLATDNYYQSNQTYRDLSKKQNQDAGIEFHKMFPMWKAQISSMVGLSPEEQQTYVDSLKPLAESLLPGGAKQLEFFHKNQSRVYALDALASHPDPTISQGVQKLIGTMDYAKAMQSKEHAAFAVQASRDWLTKTVGHFDLPMGIKRSTGKMEEAEFRELVKTQAYKDGMRPVEVATMMAHLDTPEGEQQMAGGLRIQTDASLQKKDLKEKPADLIALRKNERFTKNEELLAFAESHPGTIDPAKVNTAKEQNAIALGDVNKQSNVGINPNNRVEQRLRDLTGKNITSNDILNMPDGPEKTKLIEKLHQASVQQDEYVTKARNEGLLGMPVDMSKVDMYDRRTLQKGTISKLSVPMSEREKRTNPNLVELEPKFLGGLSKLLIAKDQGNEEMFDLADKAFPAKDAQGLAVQWAKWKALELGGPAAISVTANKANDSLVAYHDTFTAWAGKDARALGDEVGTMTDADRLVWKDTFPKPTDTPSIRKQKRAIFNRMIDLIYDVNVRVATGEQPEAVFVDKAFVSKKAGIFGSARQVVAEAQGKGLSPREKLEQQMKAE